MRINLFPGHITGADTTFLPLVWNSGRAGNFVSTTGYFITGMTIKEIGK